MNNASHRNAGAWPATWFPGCLLFAAVAAGVFPNNAMFITAAAVGSAVALAAAFLFVFRLKQFRISWILADGLLLGYSLGTLNTALRLALQGSTAAIQFARPQQDLSAALAASLAVSAFLFFVGAAAEKPVRIDAARLGRSDLLFVWAGLAAVLIAFATGRIGYMGTVSDDRHRVSMLGEIAGLWGPALPAATVFLFSKCPRGLSRVACWLLLAATLTCLIPQGRRTLLYSVLLAFVAFGLRAGAVRVTAWKQLLPVLAALPLLYAGNMIFYAMRVSSWQAGSARLSLTELTANATSILRGGHDSSFDRQIDENLRDRTFVLRYFSDLLAASWSHQPLYGRDLLFCAELAVPSVLYRDKEDVLQIGMEENLVNPEFGLVAVDEANSILTTGVSDFGAVGIFIYPLALSLLMSAFVRRLGRHVPQVVNVMVAVAVLDVMWQTEMASYVYFTLCRDLVLLALPLAIMKTWQRLARKPRPARLNVSPAAAALASILFLLLPTVSLHAETVLSVQDFDPFCGQPHRNCRAAFQKAFDAAARSGGGTLRLPAGTFPIDFTENLNPLAVPSHVMLQGHVGAGGIPDTTIEWNSTSLPAFAFVRTSYSGMKDLHLRFTGSTPARFPYGDLPLLRMPGFTSGGNYEMFSFAMLFDSGHCVFENLVFDSATHDNQHVFGFAFNVKGSGLNALADGNRFSRIGLNDYVMGFLLGGQQNIVIEDIVADRRGSTPNIAPGHVIYFTGSSQLLSKNVRVSNVSEGPHTYSNSHALGTLALKYIDGGTFEHINSQHPIGLIQSLNAVRNLVFNDLRWFSDSSACGEPADFCGAPVIESVVSKAGEPGIGNLRFTNVTLKSDRQPITTNLTGNGIEIEGITIECPPVFTRTPNQQAPYGVLGVKEASSVTVRNFVYKPVVTSLDPGARYNQPFVCWGSCTNVKADVTVEWPDGVTMPTTGHPSITSGIQFDKPGANNLIVSRTEIRRER